MSNFFHGWRRTAGCVTLVMDLVASAFWIRSFVSHDEISVIWGGEILSLETVPGRTRYERTSPIPTMFPNGRIFWSSRRNEDRQEMDPFLLMDIEWRWRLYGFYFGAATSKIFHERLELIDIPFWSIVIPLALLSAYLLLRNPRQPTEAKPMS